MKMKHNKKRNTAFIFEVLIRELTKAIVDKNNNKKTIIVSLIKENFKSNTGLSRDLELYKSLLETKDLDRSTAEKLIFECRMQRCTINQKKLFKEQSELINQINKHVTNDAFGTFIPNYRNVATVYQIFNPGTKTKQRVLLEKQIINNMIMPSEKEGVLLEPINNLTLKTFIKNFNQKYERGLRQEQKELLTKYISSFHDNGTEMKVFLHEEINRLKEALHTGIQLQEIQNDPLMLEKSATVLELLNTTSKRMVDGKFIEDILKIQNLVKELER